jgi:hypothetical protein
MRANNREAACDYCHGGGGGSSINIMMDNAYKTADGSGTQYLDGVVESTTTTGFGTGHTLGYAGMAPTDIKPAFQAGDGFACFDCHSPHGNSARVMGVVANPGRALGNSDQVIPNTQPPYIGTSTDGTIDSAGEWGVDPTFGNIKWFGNPDGNGGRLIYRPIFPAGSFLLKKDPHNTAEELEADTVVAGLGVTATDGVNKLAIDWDEPLGPADGKYGGGQDNDNDKNYPFATGGFASLSEFCVDCHDGTAGASTQAAEVYNSIAGTYTVAYSHDAQPRH